MNSVPLGASPRQNTLDGRFCLEALNEAFVRSRPEIFNTDRQSAREAQSQQSGRHLVTMADARRH
jgi:hypothetical protein